MTTTSHQYEIYIRATPEQVWQALLDPAFTRQYFHGTAFDAPPVQGRRYATSTADGAPAVDGVVEELDAPRRLVVTWHTLYDVRLAQEPPSRVEWLLEAVGEGLTRVRLVHGDLAQSPGTWSQVRHGWVWVLDGLKTLLETGSPLPPLAAGTGRPEHPEAAGEQWHRMQAVEANNSVWELLERRPGDTGPLAPAVVEELLERAYAARYHWARAAGRGPEHRARGAWLLSRVQLAIGRPELALDHAQECLALCADHDLGDFDLAYAHEAASRALWALGRADEAERAWAAAHAVPVADEEDRAQVERDLAAARR